MHYYTIYYASIFPSTDYLFSLTFKWQDTVFDSVSLTCGHIFCYMCACSAASVTIVDGLKAADPKEKCPLCREVICQCYTAPSEEELLVVTVKL